MIPIVFMLEGAKSYFNSGYKGEIRCMLDGKETIVTSYEEAKKFYEEEQK